MSPTYLCETREESPCPYGEYTVNGLSYIETSCLGKGQYEARVKQHPKCNGIEVAIYGATSVRAVGATEQEALERLDSMSITMTGKSVRAGAKTSDKPK